MGNLGVGTRLLVLAAMMAMLTACAASPIEEAASAPAPPATVRDAPPPASPAPASAPIARGGYAEHPRAAQFVQRMEAEGFRRAEVERLLASARRQPWILQQMDRAAARPSRQPTGAWTRYRERFITETNVARGVAFWRQHATTLARAEQRFGVPAEYIVAIIGVETRWGGYLGSHRVIDALATLAFDYPRRAEFFTDELANFLVLAREQGFDPQQPLGSYAGAMGLGQFMPSSARRYAVDFDGDGRPDLWNPTDAIGSVANYLAAFGWQRSQPVAMRSSAAPRILPEQVETGFNTNYTRAKLAALGVEVPPSVAADTRLRLLALDVGDRFDYWLGFENFYVITRYNHSTYYAMAVHQLAREIARQRGG